MKKFKHHEAAQAANAFQFTLAGLIIFSLALMGAASFVTYRLVAVKHPALAETFARDLMDKSYSVHAGPWGTLLTRDIQLERPVEYLTEEVSEPQPEVWTFSGMTAEAVKNLLAGNGLSAAQIAGALAPENVVEKSTGTELTPSGKFLLSLTPVQRQKLYGALAGRNVNLYLDYPYIFQNDDIQAIFADKRLQPDDAALLNKLVYPNGTAQQLADYSFLLKQIPTLERRTAMTRVLSQQSAVLARLAVNAATDIDKVAEYWGHIPNVRFTDIRPMLEALKQLPEGGSISLLYLLPKFARDRLYTFPLPSQGDGPVMDCHWTTFNFSNETPDDRFNDPKFAIEYIEKNYYPIATPSVYGDIVLLMNNKNEIKHSAVFLADDIVFTKNGNNYRQPWMLMRIPDLLATYPDAPPMRAVYMRVKTD